MKEMQKQQNRVSVDRKYVYANVDFCNANPFKWTNQEFRICKTKSISIQTTYTDRCSVIFGNAENRQSLFVFVDFEMQNFNGTMKITILLVVAHFS